MPIRHHALSLPVELNELDECNPLDSFFEKGSFQLCLFATIEISLLASERFFE
jgi:hypothetical protein